MPRAKKPDAKAGAAEAREVRLGALEQTVLVAGIPGPGRWLVSEYEPTALFSLKISLATSSVGKTLVIPTPYSIKMALVDAAFRAGLSDVECADLLRSLVGVDLRVGMSEAAAVTHTFVKVRQEAKAPNWDKKKQAEGQYQASLIQKLASLYPGSLPKDWDGLDISTLKRVIDGAYDSSIAYREVAHHYGRWLWAFDLSNGDDTLAARLVRLAPHVCYIGKRGSFVQFCGLSRVAELNEQFTQPIQNDRPWSPPPRAHVVSLDDFGPEADLATLSSFTDRSPKRDRHRKFVETIVPMGLVNTGPGFSEYRKG